MAKVAAYDKEFKESVVKYALEHPDETYTNLGKRFDVHPTTIGGWVKEYKEKNGEDVFRGSGNYSSEEAKEIAHLKKELKDTQDALEILKKAIGIVGK